MKPALLFDDTEYFPLFSGVCQQQPKPTAKPIDLGYTQLTLEETQAMDTWTFRKTRTNHGETVYYYTTAPGIFWMTWKPEDMALNYYPKTNELVFVTPHQNGCNWHEMVEYDEAIVPAGVAEAKTRLMELIESTR